MSFLPPAVPSGSTQEQLSRLYAYLFQMVEQLNLAMEAIDSRAVKVETRANAAGQEISRTGSEITAQASALKQMIIKNADIIRSEMHTLETTLTGSYVAISDFGSYVENLSNQITADPSGINQYYSFIGTIKSDMEKNDAAFRSYISRMEGYIRTGIVGYEADGVTPVLGVAVGQGLTSAEADGKAVITSEEFRSVFTARKLSFYRGGQEVAYLSNDRLYITDITVLGTIQFGQQDREQWEIGQNSQGFYIKWIGA